MPETEITESTPLKRGRPKIEGPKPWERLGWSRRTYFRRKKLGLIPKGKKPAQPVQAP
jgi:hypothetical protein